MAQSSGKMCLADELEKTIDAFLNGVENSLYIDHDEGYSAEVQTKQTDCEVTAAAERLAPIDSFYFSESLSKGTRIVAIDPGEFHYAMAFFDGKRLKCFAMESIVNRRQGERKKRCTMENNPVSHLKKFVEDRQDIFRGSIVVTERQMNVVMQKLNVQLATILQILYDIPCFSMSPVCKLGMNKKVKYSQKKRMSTDLVLGTATTKGLISETNCDFVADLEKMKKRDDVCDCILMILYILKTNKKSLRLVNS
jgi:hypothetical protein